VLRLQPLGHLSRCHKLRLYYQITENAKIKKDILDLISKLKSHIHMSRTYTIRVRDRATGKIHTLQVPEDRYILHTAEKQGVELPFSCRNGACTTCAVRVLSGEIYQPEAIGLSPELRRQGYALLCVSYARSDLEVETQDEDEVYELQFGRYFGRGKVKAGLPLDEE
jgi:ferredoxin